MDSENNNGKNEVPSRYELPLGQREIIDLLENTSFSGKRGKRYTLSRTYEFIESLRDLMSEYNIQDLSFTYKDWLLPDNMDIMIERGLLNAALERRDVLTSPEGLEAWQKVEDFLKDHGARYVAPDLPKYYPPMREPPHNYSAKYYAVIPKEPHSDTRTKWVQRAKKQSGQSIWSDDEAGTQSINTALNHWSDIIYQQGDDDRESPPTPPWSNGRS